MTLEFYRHLYDSEWERRAEVRQAASIPMGVLALLAGVLVFYGRSYSYPAGWMSYLFTISLATACVAFAVAVYMLCSSFFGPKYRRIPWPSQIRDYEESLKKFHGGSCAATTKAVAEWESFIIDRYIDAANRNSENNANAGEFVHKANRAVVVVLIAAGIGAGPVIVDYRVNQSTYQKFEIIKLEDLRDGGEEPDVKAADQHRDAVGRGSEPADKADASTEH